MKSQPYRGPVQPTWTTVIPGIGTPVFLAAAGVETAKAVQLLLEAGADVNARTSHCFGSEQVVRLFE